VGYPWYATRGDVKGALDVKETARANVLVDRAAASGSRAVESLLSRVFYPTTATRYFDWPNDQYARPWRLWLNDNELLSVTTLTSGGTTIGASGYFLEPANYGPPYDRVEINLASASAFTTGSTHQRAIAITGVWGYDNRTAPAGALAGAINASVTTVAVTDSSLVDAGSLLLADTERLMVTGQAMITTGQTLQTATLASSAAATTVAVTTGSGYAVGETILIDSERMLIVDIASNSLTVRRSWDGSTLAAHTSGATIFAPRSLTVTRGATGSTAASHLDAAPLTTQLYPSLVRELAIAEAVNLLRQEGSAYSGTVGADPAQSASGGGLGSIRAMAYAQYGRKARQRAV